MAIKITRKHVLYAQGARSGSSSPQHPHKLRRPLPTRGTRSHTRTCKFIQVRDHTLASTAHIHTDIPIQDRTHAHSHPTAGWEVGGGRWQGGRWQVAGGKWVTKLKHCETFPPPVTPVYPLQPFCVVKHMIFIEHNFSVKLGFTIELVAETRVNRHV